MVKATHAERVKKRYTTFLDDYLKVEPISSFQNDQNEKVLDDVISQKEEKEIENFLNSGCKCGELCQNQFTKKELMTSRTQFRSLSTSEKNCYILAQLRVFSKYSETVFSARSSKLRKRRKFQYRINSDRVVCRDAFLFYHGESIKRLQRLQECLEAHPISPPVHGNMGNKYSKVFSEKDREYVKTFILSFSEIHGLPDPGRDVRKGKGRLRILLPSILNYTTIHHAYQESLLAMECQGVSYRTFLNIWKEELPHIEFNHPKSDLCMTCENFKKEICQVTADSVEEKERKEEYIYKQALDHLNHVKKERLYYKSYAHESVLDYEKMKNVVTSSVKAVNSIDMVMSYSWDFAQQIQYPFEEQQVGPIFFKTPRKAQLFGVCCEGSQEQVNYLIDESDFTEKNSNTVISLLDHFFDHYSLGETTAYLTADNCVGQNKNNAVIQYLMYRVLSDLHTEIELSFLVVGHTKFSPDSHFGSLKRKYRLSHVYTYEQLADIIEQSAQNRYNRCHQCRSDDRVVYRNWSGWLSKYFKTIPNITKYHHFVINRKKNGVLSLKESVEDKGNEFSMLKQSNIDFKSKRLYPAEYLTPKGLSLERQWYLYEQIRKHIPNEIDQDKTCPKPLQPKP